MESEEEVKKAETMEDQARNISHKVRCTKCGSQSLEDTGRYCYSSQKEPILLHGTPELIQDEIGAGKTDKEIYKKLEEDFGETGLYAPKFDLQSAAL